MDIFSRKVRALNRGESAVYFPKKTMEGALELQLSVRWGRIA